ncbi:MAG: hypothetical protein OEY31_14890, partial [Candidatus Bathyarchaeota archaeon]|nr:hypothetical protein [Candidatus Bathyarchaeota archaeon]
WDASYGWGVVDAFEAVTLAANVEYVDGNDDGGSVQSFPWGMPSFEMPAFEMSSMSVTAVLEIVEVLFFEFVEVGYDFMMPAGFGLLIAAGIALSADSIVRGRRK